MFHVYEVIYTQPEGNLKLYVTHLHYDCDLSHEVRCEIFHQWHQIDP